MNILNGFLRYFGRHVTKRNFENKKTKKGGKGDTIINNKTNND